MYLLPLTERELQVLNYVLEANQNRELIEEQVEEDQIPADSLNVFESLCEKVQGALNF